MQAFLAVFGHLVLGVLHGFDRLVFRGHLRQLSFAHGMDCYLSANHVLLKDFTAHAKQRTAELIDASLAEARRLNRPIVYLNSSQLSKEEQARKIAQQDQIRDGLIGVFKCVEPCWTFEVHRNRQRKMLELQGKQGKCAYLYHYFIHPVFGFMHARIQTWFPYAVQVCLNGREWLARQMDRAGLTYQRHDNKFVDLENFAQAQALMDRQLREAWPKRLGEILRRIHPAHPDLLGRLPVDYYWSVYQSEWASDVVFRSRADVQRLFPQWVRHAITTYQSTDVLRFLGREVPRTGQVRKGFQGEVVSELCRREEGVRVKHWVNGNSVKAYDCDRLLRFETTINNPEDFKVYRTSEADPQGEQGWLILRKGIADLHRRAEVSQAVNERYAAATAAMAKRRRSKKWPNPCAGAQSPRDNPAAQSAGLEPLGSGRRHAVGSHRRPQACDRGLAEPRSGSDALCQAVAHAAGATPPLGTHDTLDSFAPRPRITPQDATHAPLSGERRRSKNHRCPVGGATQMPNA